MQKVQLSYWVQKSPWSLYTQNEAWGLFFFYSHRDLSIIKFNLWSKQLHHFIMLWCYFSFCNVPWCNIYSVISKMNMPYKTFHFSLYLVHFFPTYPSISVTFRHVIFFFWLWIRMLYNSQLLLMTFSPYFYIKLVRLNE